MSTDVSPITEVQHHTDVYLYSRGGESKFRLLGQSPGIFEQVKNEVNVNMTKLLHYQWYI